MVVVVTVAQPYEGRMIVPYHDRSHLLGNRDLPRVILTETLRGAPLTRRHFIGVHPVDSLPRKSSHIRPDSLRLVRSF